jgi:hypothetical protein
MLTAGGAPAWGGSTDHLRHQKRQAAQDAAQLDAHARHQAAEVAKARRALARLNDEATTALAALQRASLAADRARDARAAAEEALAAAQAHTLAAREELNDLAAGAYRTMAAGGSIATTLSLVQHGDPQTFIDGMQVLGQVGKRQAEVIDELRVAEADELRAEHVATAAADRATTAERGAATAKREADALVAEQQGQVGELRTLLARTRTAAAAAHAQQREFARRLARARAKAAAIRARQAAAAASYTGPIPTCNGGTVSGYANGQLPVSALCPLWGAPGQMLRSDAAAAFNRMSKAYSDVFGVPLCVTSSYRTYQRQVELYASMPAGYAAVPGTSNHGWGLAVDLCGGIQVDGSPEHNWLLDHAAAYSWFHPSWALPGGPGPHEPWHWEYAG